MSRPLFMMTLPAGAGGRKPSIAASSWKRRSPLVSKQCFQHRRSPCFRNPCNSIKMHQALICILIAVTFIKSACSIGLSKQDSTLSISRVSKSLKSGGQYEKLLSSVSALDPEAGRLRLRGGGLPIPLLLGAAAITATAANEEIRSKFLKALSNVRIGPYQYTPKAKPKKVGEVPKKIINLAPNVSPKLDVRNGTWAVEVVDEVEVCVICASW